jgi:hypothetical protein
MTLANQIAKNFREVFFGDNWTDVNLKDTLQNVTLQQAVAKVQDLNTIALLVFHINYYVDRVLKVLDGEPLNASDKFSFGLEPLQSEEDWQKLVTKAMAQAEEFASKIEQWDDQKFFEDFANPKYGNNYHNIVGITEHAYYHLGQIVLIKKLLAKM